MTGQEHLPDRRKLPDVSVHNNQGQRNDKERQSSSLYDKWWLLAFLINTIAYLGASAWINYSAISKDEVAITDGTTGPVNTERLMMLCAAVAIGFVAALMAFGMVVFVTFSYHWWVIGATLLASGVPLGMTIWKTNTSGGVTYTTGLIIISIVGSLVIYFFLMPGRRETATLKMYQCFRYLMRGDEKAYLLIIGWTLFQAALELWCSLSVAAVIIRFQPNAEGCSAEDSLCGWDMVSAITSVFIWAQLWLATTLSEVLNATLAAGVFSKASLPSQPPERGEVKVYMQKAPMSVGESLKLAGYRSLGSLTRNAFFSDTVEFFFWPLEALDRFTVISNAVGSCSGWYLRLLSGVMRKYNKFIGVSIAIGGYKKDHHGARSDVYRLVKDGNTREELRGERLNIIGVPMGTVKKALRLGDENTAEADSDTYWKTGLGAFMGSHVSKSFLTIGAIACGLLAAGAIYSVIIFRSKGPNFALDTWDWAVVGWSFVSAYTVSYHLLMVIDACVCSLYFIIQKYTAAQPMSNIKPLGECLEAIDKVQAGLYFKSLV